MNNYRSQLELLEISVSFINLETHDFDRTSGYLLKAVDKTKKIVKTTFKNCFRLI